MVRVRERKEVRLGPWLVELSLIAADADDDAVKVEDHEPPPRVLVRVVDEGVEARRRPHVVVMEGGEDEEDEETTRISTAPPPRAAPSAAARGESMPQQPVRHGRKKRKLDEDEATDDNQPDDGDGDGDGDGDEGEAGATQLAKRRAVMREEEEEGDEMAFSVELEMLPDEVQLRVLSKLSAVDLVTSVPLVCRRWRHLARDPTLWLHLHRRTFGGRPVKRRLKYDLAERASSIHWRASWREQDIEPVSRPNSTPWQEPGADGEELVDCLANLMELARADYRLDDDMQKLAKCKRMEVLELAIEFDQAVSVRESLETIERLDAQASVRPNPLLMFKNRTPPEPYNVTGDWSLDLCYLLPVACQHQRVEVAQILLDHGAFFDDCAMEAGFQSSVAASMLILDHVPHEDIRELVSDYRLANIATYGRADVMRLLVAQGIITQMECESALASGLAKAVALRKLEPVARLLEAGVSANTLTSRTHKPLLTKLMRWKFDGETMAIAELLVARGACFDQQIPSRVHLTQLERAVRFGRRRAVGWLLAIGARPILRMKMVMRRGKRYPFRRKGPTKALRACWAMVAAQAARRPKYAGRQSWTFDFGNGEADSDEDVDNEQDKYDEEKVEFARLACLHGDDDDEKEENGEDADDASSEDEDDGNLNDHEWSDDDDDDGDEDDDEDEDEEDEDHNGNIIVPAADSNTNGKNAA